jgi:hypothetical protein
MTQVLPGEIRNIFDHLRDSGSELKSEWLKSSIATCPVSRRDQWLLTNQHPGGIISENLPAPDDLSHQGKTGLKHPKLIPPKLSDKEEQHSIATQPTIPSLGKDRNTEKALVKKYQYLDSEKFQNVQ